MKSKKLRIMRVLAGLLLVLAMAAPVVSHAEDAVTPAPVILDGQEFQRQQLHQAFMSSVFTKDILNESRWGIEFHYPNDFTGEVSDFLAPERLREKYPWLYPHIYVQNPPKLLAVNKWVEPIRISFGMPGEFTGFHIGSSDKVEENSFKKSDDFKALESHVTNFSKDISSVTPIGVSYLARDQENDKHYGNIRINLLSINLDLPKAEMHKYKTRGGGMEWLSSWVTIVNFRRVEDLYIKNGFVFTASSKKQVDGYILSNGKNEIEMAVCYIWIGHEPEMMKSLINECIIRSLGFPGFVYPGDMKDPFASSYLMPWNEPEILRYLGSSVQEKVKVPSGLSEFDQYMIRTLYNPALKPGMDYIQAQDILRTLN